jgi:hypothetical protein
VFWVFKSSDTFGKNVMVEVAKNLQVDPLHLPLFFPISGFNFAILAVYQVQPVSVSIILLACSNRRVATPSHSRTLQAPIKLLFPKNFDPEEAGKNFSMLGINLVLKASRV